MLRVEEKRRRGRISLYDYIGYDDHRMPHFDTILEDGTMPAQNTEMLGTEIPLWYYDVNYMDKQRGIFTVCRWDTESPNRIILVNNTLHILLVTGEDKVIEDGTDQADEDGRHVSNAYVHKVPVQWDELVGIECWIEYPKGTYKNRGLILKADQDSDHPEFVIYETTEDGKSRLITAEEARIVVQYVDIAEKPYKNYEWWPTDLGVFEDEDDSSDSTESDGSEETGVSD